MSNFLAVATVTAVLQKLLEQDVVGDVPGATVTTDRPDTKKAQTAPAINVFLYHVEPSPALRDADLPTRRPDGTLAQRARAAVDLHYLLTFYGNDAEFEPQRLLGATVRTFHARPIITRDLIAAVVAAAGANTPRHASLGSSAMVIDVMRGRSIGATDTAGITTGRAVTGVVDSSRSTTDADHAMDSTYGTWKKTDHSFESASRSRACGQSRTTSSASPRSVSTSEA